MAIFAHQSYPGVVMSESQSADLDAIRLKCPADFIAVVPYLLGYHPSASCVAIAIEGSELKCVLRFDLPERAEDAMLIAHQCTVTMTRMGTPKVYLIGYGSGSQVTPVMDAVPIALDGTGIEILDMLRCEDGRYWSYLDVDCCSPDGTPYDVSSNPAAASAVVAGKVAMADRTAFEGIVAPVRGPDREAVRRATALACRRTTRMLGSAKADFWFAEGRRQLRKCFDEVEAGRPIPADDVAWVGVLLTAVLIRDIGLTFADQYGTDVSIRLWAEVTRRVEPQFAPAPAVNLALLAMRIGDGPLARAAAERALREAPGHQFATLILQGLSVGVPPEVLAEQDLTDLAARIGDLAERAPTGAMPVLPSAHRST
ncbi:DUF4192 domain-containing protein [Spongiactinospora sp. TRM90649]|uniref:DUF4192 domain-containing protein n=1 Tax=Spongiactinospora sp. TRM90649 TaxID=3031114 RepID=UPI0023FA34B9|nr:DUF4192 domain-containing protein [Spongiactinospora sp. TRM90649]MDF5759069.1 DUF4192 domain-containing protein [Spongiactinospora sp. TRM90649]